MNHSNTVIDVEAKLIEVIDYPKIDWLFLLMHYLLILPTSLVGMVVSLLWIAGKFGIGNFTIYYGASRVCGA